jgi:hypothetical protein
MKIQCGIVLILAMAGSMQCQQTIGSASVTLMGEFVIKDKPGELLPPFTLYFDGNLVTSDTSGAYTITISKEDVAAGRLDDFSLMICKRIGLDYEQGHTLAGMKLKKLEKCVWYKLDREWDEELKKHYWKIEQQEVKDTDCVPEKCLLVLMSSQYVDAVQDTAHLALNADRIDGVLPTIVLKDDPVVLSRASTKCAIESIDMRQHTAPQRVQTLTQNGVICALHGG